MDYLQRKGQGAVNPPEERYFISTPCKRGHSGRRYKSTGACVECQRMHHVARHPPKNLTQPLNEQTIRQALAVLDEQDAQEAQYKLRRLPERAES